MLKIKHLFSLIFLFCIGAIQAQSLSVVDCSTVLIVPENTTLSIDTTMDITLDSLWNSQTDFGIMFIVETSDSALVNKVHIDLGYTVGDSTLLNTSYDSSDNISGSTSLIYDAYSDFINIKVGEFTVDSVLHYNVRLEDASGNLTSPYSGTINH